MYICYLMEKNVCFKIDLIYFQLKVISMQVYLKPTGIRHLFMLPQQQRQVKFVYKFLAVCLLYNIWFIWYFLLGFCASTATNPIWMIKTRLQLDRARDKTLNIKNCFQNIYKEHVSLFHPCNYSFLILWKLGLRSFFSRETWNAVKYNFSSFLEFNCSHITMSSK